MKPATPKQIVLKKYPKATLSRWGNLCAVVDEIGGGLLSCYTERGPAYAWTVAARFILHELGEAA